MMLCIFDLMRNFRILVKVWVLMLLLVFSGVMVGV